MSIDLSLDRISRLVDKLPEYTRRTVHIAGTNGKGSVASLVSSILLASSLTVGRFNSPHLVSIYDCITINNIPISPEDYDFARGEVQAVDNEHGIGASSFEILTLTALRVFEVKSVDVVVLEVGMGGRLDATNVVPDACVIVSALASVDLDHQTFLGNTVEEIAREKAGIARRGVTFVLGPQRHASVGPVVEGVVKVAGARLVVAGTARRCAGISLMAGVSLVPGSFVAPGGQPVRVSVGEFGELDVVLPLHGDHQLDNLGLAGDIISAALPVFGAMITASSIVEGIKSTSWAGRLSFHPFDLPSGLMTILADGAHNPASSATLGAYVRELLENQKPISLTYILALSDSPPKTPLQTLTPVLSSLGEDVDVGVAVLRFSPPEGMPWVKSVSPSELKRVVGELVLDADVWEGNELLDSGNLRQALEWASQRASGKPRSLVVLAGSLYLVADFYRILKV